MLGVECRQGEEYFVCDRRRTSDRCARAPEKPGAVLGNWSKYVLMQAFRQHCLYNTCFAQATVGTIRLKLLKLGARITVSVRRILIAIASACPSQNILAIAYSRIQALPTPG